MNKIYMKSKEIVEIEPKSIKCVMIGTPWVSFY
jgi:hypothetical protein